MPLAGLVLNRAPHGSGDYIHSAPWSVGEQGYVNVSHGCVNVAPAQAAWYYDHSLIGDPITIVGSPLAGTWGDGWTIWFLPWRKLLGGSATGEAVAAGSSGSRLVTPSLGPGATPRQRLRAALRGLTGSWPARLGHVLRPTPGGRGPRWGVRYRR